MKLTTKPSDLLLGSDPEIFLTRDGKIISAIDLIGGSKEKPLVVKDGTLQEDNIMAEIGINPTNNVEEFIRRHKSVMAELVVKTRAQPLITASEIIDKMILTANPNRAFKFGCDPDFNAYTQEANPNPDPSGLLRTCAGHIHLGFEAEDKNADGACDLIKHLDVTVGLWSVLVDKDDRRREKYGKAGAFRPKSYGLEYRVPSNFWLQNDSLMKEVFERTVAGYTNMFKGVSLLDPTKVQAAINTYDRESATNLLKEAGAY